MYCRSEHRYRIIICCLVHLDVHLELELAKNGELKILDISFQHRLFRFSIPKISTKKMSLLDRPCYNCLKMYSMYDFLSCCRKNQNTEKSCCQYINIGENGAYPTFEQRNIQCHRYYQDLRAGQISKRRF